MRRPEPLPQRPRVETPDEPIVDEPERVDDVVAFTPSNALDAGDVEDNGETPATFSWAGPSDVASIATRDDSDDVVTVSDEVETAVITPFPLRGDAASTDAEVRSAPGATDSSEDDVEASNLEAEPSGDLAVVGWRDVWRAARAKRKALRREVRRFTARARRRRLIWIVSLSSLAAVIVGSFAVAYSPLFAVQKITVVGTTSLDPAAVTQSLSGQLGTPLALVNESEIKAALVTFPAVETYTVQARPPHELVVTVVERTPVGVVETEAGYSLVDAAGVVLSTTPEPPPGYPLFQVAGGLGESTFRSAGMVMLSIPDSIRGSVAKVTATTPADVTLTLSPTGTQIIWGNADDSQIKSQVLEKAMLTRPIDTVSVYDVSSPTAIVMR